MVSSYNLMASLSCVSCFCWSFQAVTPSYGRTACSSYSICFLYRSSMAYILLLSLSTYLFSLSAYLFSCSLTLNSCNCLLSSLSSSNSNLWYWCSTKCTTHFFGVQPLLSLEVVVALVLVHPSYKFVLASSSWSPFSPLHL